MKSHPDFQNSRKESYDKHNKDSRYNRSHFKKPSESYESEKHFDSPIQFKKPANDTKGHKKLNEFKSSRKYNYSNYSESYEKTKHNDFSEPKKVHNEKIESVHIKSSTHNSYKSDNENRIPAWKKAKYFPEKVDEAKLSGKMFLFMFLSYIQLISTLL